MSTPAEVLEQVKASIGMILAHDDMLSDTSNELLIEALAALESLEVTSGTMNGRLIVGASHIVRPDGPCHLLRGKCALLTLREDDR